MADKHPVRASLSRCKHRGPAGSIGRNHALTRGTAQAADPPRRPPEDPPAGSGAFPTDASRNGFIFLQWTFREKIRKPKPVYQRGSLTFYVIHSPSTWGHPAGLLCFVPPLPPLGRCQPSLGSPRPCELGAHQVGLTPRRRRSWGWHVSGAQCRLFVLTTVAALVGIGRLPPAGSRRMSRS